MQNNYSISNKYSKDNTLLQLPFFFFYKNRSQEMKITWEDEEGKKELLCKCTSGVPGAFEQDVFTAVLYLWTNLNNCAGELHTNCSQIAKVLKLDPKKWYNQIRKALQTLSDTEYKLTECFIEAREDGNRIVSTSFSLITIVKMFSRKKGISNRASRSIIEFPEIITKNMELGYSQNLDINDYLCLASGLPRRMYEYLQKRSYHRKGGLFAISEEKLCRWLGVRDKNSTNRRKTIAKAAAEMMRARLLEGFEFDSKNKRYIFTYSKKSQIFVEKVEIQELDDCVLEKLFGLVKLNNISQRLKQALAGYYQEHGSEYVERNILYANKNAKRSYSNYLLKSLANDFAAEWAEEEKIRQKAREEHEAAKYQSTQVADCVADEVIGDQAFRDAVASLDVEILASLKQQAHTQNDDVSSIGRENVFAYFACSLQDCLKEKFPGVDFDVSNGLYREAFMISQKI